MKLLTLRVLSLSMVAAAAIAAGCYHDNADRFQTDSLVTFNDGVTPIGGFLADSYDAQFWLSNGVNVVRTYSPEVYLNGTTRARGILADSSGRFSVSDGDVYLNSTYDEVECYSTCLDFSTRCYVDEIYGDLVCEDYCSLYADDCYIDTETQTYDFGSVVAVDTFLTYDFGGRSVTTISFEDAAQVASTDNLSSLFRTETFVTPFDVSAASEDGKAVLASQALTSGDLSKLPKAKLRLSDGRVANRALTLVGEKSIKGCRRVGAKEQNLLTDEQMAKVRATREALGIQPSQVVGRL